MGLAGVVVRPAGLEPATFGFEVRPVVVIGGLPSPTASPLIAPMIGSPHAGRPSVLRIREVKPVVVAVDARRVLKTGREGITADLARDHCADYRFTYTMSPSTRTS